MNFIGTDLQGRYVYRATDGLVAGYAYVTNEIRATGLEWRELARATEWLEHDDYCRRYGQPQM